MTRPPDRLTKLPTELLAGVLELLDAFTLVACMLACRKLKILIDNTMSLKYILALEAAGMKDGHNSTLSLIERAHRLDAYHSAWRTLTWSDERVVTFPGDAVAFVSGGFLVAVEPPFVHIWQIPSKWRGVDARPPLRLEFPSDEVHGVWIEPSEDLLAMFCEEGIELCSASSGLPHPKPQIFDVELDPTVPVDVLGKFICGFSDEGGPSGYATVYNWHTGNKMEVIWAIDLCLLEDEYLLVFEHVNATGDGALVVYDCLAIDEGENLSPGDEILSLLLPAFRHGVSHDSSFGASPRGTRGNPHSGHFFSAQSDVRLLRATIELYPDFTVLPTFCQEGGRPAAPAQRKTVPDFQVLILSSVVAKYIAASRRRRAFSEDAGPEPFEVPWNEWAPGNVLLRPAPWVPSGPFLPKSGCGCRALELVRPDLVKIYDFHPWRVRRAAKAGARTETLTGRIEKEWLRPDAARSGEVFVDTFLECTTAEYAPPFEVDSVANLMLAEDALVIFPVRRSDLQFHICSATSHAVRRYTERCRDRRRGRSARSPCS
ncbi:hypothetical protein OF83DRAFT_407323 [Amylostereum chailletii]|nr:hypothetical protein OF83DRAFT_407323 [Amylostereum chailletii]